MFYPWGYPPALVARRFLARAARRLILNPTTMLLTTALVAFWIVGGPASRTVNTAPPADTTDQAAEGYMRALRDRDSAQLFKILSPEMRGRLERQSGRAGPAAATWVFNESDRRGERIVDYRMVGRDKSIQEETIYFYLVRAQRGNERHDVPYTLTVSADGKVTGVE